MRNHLICTICKLSDFLIPQIGIHKNEKKSHLDVDF